MLPAIKIMSRILFLYSETLCYLKNMIYSCFINYCVIPYTLSMLIFKTVNSPLTTPTFTLVTL